MAKRKELLFVLVISVLFMLRILFLDSDVKNFQITQIPVTIDEIYDNEIALNIQQHGLLQLFTGVGGDVTSSNSKTLLMSNVVAGIFMTILGNNFYGLRVGYVFLGWICLVLLWYCVRQCFPESKVLKLGILTAFLLDFNILMLSRSAMTVIPCIFACLIYYAGYLKLQNKRKSLYFFMGIWPVISLCLIYMGLPFLGLGGFLFMVIHNLMDQSRSRKQKTEGCGFYLLGNLFGALICEIVSLIIYRQHIVKTLLDTLVAHSGKVEGSFTINNFDLICIRILQYITSYAFKYNFLVLMLFLIALFMIAKNIRELWSNKKIIFLLVLVGTHWLQTLFLDNMTQSKATITFPIILLLIGYGIIIWQNKNKRLTGKQIKIERIGIAGIAIFSLVIMAISHKGETSPFTTPFDSAEKIAWLLLSLVIAILLIFYYYGNYRSCLLFGYLLSVISMLVLSTRYVYMERSYVDREIAIDLGKVIGDTPTIGGHSKGFALYNNMNAILCDYDKYRGIGYDEQYVEEKIYEYTMQYEDLFYLGYASTDMDYINKVILGEDSPYQYKLLKTYKRAYWLKEMGDSDMSVWEKVKK